MTQRPIGRIRRVSSASGMKSHGRHDAAHGVVPAQERLDRDDAVGVEVEHRLVDEVELVLVDRGAQLLDEDHALERGVDHAVLVDAVLAAAGVLGGVHRDVGVAQQRLGALGVGGGERDADAGAGGDAVLAERDRAGERVEQALGRALGVREVGDVLEQDGELVAAQAGDGVLGADGLAQARGDGREQACRRRRGRG